MHHLAVGNFHRNTETPKFMSHLANMHSPPGGFWNFPGTQQFMQKQIIFIQFTVHIMPLFTQNKNNEKKSLNLAFLSLKYRVSFDSPPCLQQLSFALRNSVQGFTQPHNSLIFVLYSITSMAALQNLSSNLNCSF